MSKNVMIPLPLLMQTVELLEYMNMSDYDFVIQQNYANILNAFLSKKQSLELREAYSKIVYANDDDARHGARMRYLQQKRLYDEL